MLFNKGIFIKMKKAINAFLFPAGVLLTCLGMCLCFSESKPIKWIHCHHKGFKLSLLCIFFVLLYMSYISEFIAYFPPHLFLWFKSKDLRPGI